MPLYYLSIAYNGETWYEKHFGAVQQNIDKHTAYKKRVSELLHNPSEKPSNFLNFLQIIKAPSVVHKELETYYLPTNTYSEFFHAIPKLDRCRLLRPWIKEFMDFYLKRVFSNFDWKINLNMVGGKSHKTRKHTKKQYYCPTGFVRNGNNTYTNIGVTINDI